MHSVEFHHFTSRYPCCHSNFICLSDRSKFSSSCATCSHEMAINLKFYYFKYKSDFKVASAIENIAILIASQIHMSIRLCNLSQHFTEHEKKRKPKQNLYFEVQFLFELRRRNTKNNIWFWVNSTKHISLSMNIWAKEKLKIYFNTNAVIQFIAHAFRQFGWHTFIYIYLLKTSNK